MDSQDIHKKRIPETPGVYFFLGSKKKILYIGRATSLRDRVRSYFSGDIEESRSPWIGKMLPLIKSVDFTKTDSVLEAILLEADLIKKFQPPYNTEQKDDKSFNYIVITKEIFPRILLVRGKTLQATADSGRFTHLQMGSDTAQNLPLLSAYGPFPSARLIKEALKIIRKIFPFRDNSCRPGQGRPCFNRQIGLCPGICTGEVKAKEYKRRIQHLRLFLSGKKRRLASALTREMRAAAQAEEFERADILKRQIFALTHIQDIALLSRTANYELPTTHCRIEAYDLSHFGGTGIVGGMSVVVNGEAEPSQYRRFLIKGGAAAHEAAGLKEILLRRLRHSEWPLPNLIVVDGNEVQKRAAEQAVAAAGFAVPVVAVVKDEAHRPREILGRETLAATHKTAILLGNSEAHRFALAFQRTKRRI